MRTSEILALAKRLGVWIPWLKIAEFVGRVLWKVAQGKPLGQAILETAREMFLGGSD